ncbi:MULTISPECIES: hypothetical protein [unclassified Campylobacter]|nr:MULTISPECIES: hypothetical protein [unclassified Campylobacter]MDA3044868.1 hypothetical protein [Campylobacter sp. JMF_07 ED4]MDA3063904.1 hypothetical protein [Campylobacter sp. JMF_11 EL3]MDA3075066.1 hypothetical protein [Campylobacter sp. JMF_05 ED3]
MSVKFCVIARRDNAEAIYEIKIPNLQIRCHCENLRSKFEAI